jgi:hypothetical protein
MEPRNNGVMFLFVSRIKLLSNNSNTPVLHYSITPLLHGSVLDDVLFYAGIWLNLVRNPP